tara:strand:+ start:314 stop:2680 length:2367 start_codon:yes stop_codon:yes gene_type:complete
MAKNYQRHSKGGRFKRADIGDGGIRPYREQQRNIIDAIKLQQAQDKDISRDQLSGMRETAQAEANNRQILADLESSIYSVKRENIQKRQKTEVERLEDQAKEYEKQSQFWKDFSTTYSKQYGQAASEVWDFKDRMWANKSQEFFIDQYPNLLNFEADNLREGAHKTLEESLKETLRENNDEESKTVLRLMSRTNKHLDKIKVKAFTDDINSIEQNLKKTVIEDEGGLKWNSNTILGHYQQAAKNLIIRSGIRQNSAEARELYALFTRKGTALANQQNLKDDSILDKENIDNALLAVKAANNASRPQALKELYGYVKTATRQDKDGKFSIGIVNPKEAYWATGQLLADRYDNEDMFVEHMQSMPVSNQKGEEVPWSVRFEKQAAFEEERLREIWLDANKGDIQDKKNRKALEDEAGTEEVGAVLGREDFDITTKEGIKELNALEFKHAGNPDTLKLIQTAKSFNFEGKNKFYLTEQLVKSWKDGAPEEFLEVYNLSNAEFKAKFKPLFADIQALTSASPGGEGITSYAEGYILRESKMMSFNNPQQKMLEDVVTAYESAFYKKFHELRNVEDPVERWSQARDYVDGLVESETGVFRREETGGVVTWLAFEVEQDTSFEPETLDEELNVSDAAISTKINNIITNHKNGTKSLVSQDSTDLLLRNIDSGKTASVPYNIQKLWHHKKDKKAGETIEDFASEILDIDIPEGTYKLYEFIDKQSPLRVPGMMNFTELEKAYVNGIRMEFDEWPTSTQLTTLIEAAGGLENITEDNNYYSLNEPVRDWTLYFRQP